MPSGGLGWLGALLMQPLGVPCRFLATHRLRSCIPVSRLAFVQAGNTARTFESAADAMSPIWPAGSGLVGLVLLVPNPHPSRPLSPVPAEPHTCTPLQTPPNNTALHWKALDTCCLDLSIPSREPPAGPRGLRSTGTCGLVLVASFATTASEQPAPSAADTRAIHKTPAVSDNKGPLHPSHPHRPPPPPGGAHTPSWVTHLSCNENRVSYKLLTFLRRLTRHMNGVQTH